MNVKTEQLCKVVDVQRNKKVKLHVFAAMLVEIYPEILHSNFTFKLQVSHMERCVIAHTDPRPPLGEGLNQHKSIFNLLPLPRACKIVSKLAAGIVTNFRELC